MRVCVPIVNSHNERYVFQPNNEGGSMIDKFKAKEMDKLFYMINKPPRWNDSVGAYVLNFNGRVTMASVKNFQLINPEDQERVVLQFGRVGKDRFTMDFMWPLSQFAFHKRFRFKQTNALKTDNHHHADSSLLLLPLQLRRGPAFLGTPACASWRASRIMVLWRRTVSQRCRRRIWHFLDSLQGCI